MPLTVKELVKLLDQYHDDDLIYVQARGVQYEVIDVCETDDDGSIWIEIEESR